MRMIHSSRSNVGSKVLEMNRIHQLSETVEKPNHLFRAYRLAPIAPSLLYVSSELSTSLAWIHSRIFVSPTSARCIYISH